MIKTLTTSIGIVCTNERGDIIAIVDATGAGIYNVTPDPLLTHHLGSMGRICLGYRAALLYVECLSAEWETLKPRGVVLETKRG